MIKIKFRGVNLQYLEILCQLKFTYSMEGLIRIMFEKKKKKKKKKKSKNNIIIIGYTFPFIFNSFYSFFKLSFLIYVNI